MWDDFKSVVLNLFKKYFCPAMGVFFFLVNLTQISVNGKMYLKKENDFSRTVKKYRVIVKNKNRNPSLKG